jgi:predicted dehydrogenase
MFAIVGSGFGLYGYLPALVEAFGEPVLLPEAYRAKVEARPELGPYLASIRWAADTRAALAQATGAVVATPPARQLEVAAQCLALSGLTSLVLEKPLAPSPAAATKLLGALRASGKRYLVGYTLLHTRWHERLAWPASGEVAITWSFMAHHFARDLHNWKRVHAEGGGVLRFFGVHLLALLARHGYRDVRQSSFAGSNPAAPERWLAVFAGEGVPDCRVDVDSRSTTSAFRIEAAGAPPLVDLADPYAAEPLAQGDRRVGVLKRFLGTLPSAAGEQAFYEDVNRLWQRAEDATGHPEG